MGAMKAIFTEAQELREAAAKAADDADFAELAREQGWISPTEFAAMQTKVVEATSRAGALAFLADPTVKHESTKVLGYLVGGVSEALDADGSGTFTARVTAGMRDVVTGLAADLTLGEPSLV